VIISVVISNLLNASVFLAASPPFYYMIYPPFAYYRGIFLFEDACIDFACFQLKDLSSVCFFSLKGGLDGKMTK